MTKLYVMRIGKSKKISHQEESAHARLLLAMAVKREYGFDLADYPEQKNENGKPYLEGASFCFNLSHSGEYAVCALSESEVGVDLEKIKPISRGVMLRFVGQCGESDEENTRLWTRYEAIGKFLGCGIPYTQELPRDCFVKEYFDLDGYALSVCSAYDDFADRVIELEF